MCVLEIGMEKDRQQIFVLQESKCDALVNFSPVKFKC